MRSPGCPQFSTEPPDDSAEDLGATTHDRCRCDGSSRVREVVSALERDDPLLMSQFHRGRLITDQSGACPNEQSAHPSS
jgi:hypothetical protein